jgi:ADP-heptose:LPS heptosyltransferase
MKPSALRAVDRWVGLPACAFLTLHRRLFGGSALVEPITRILFVKLAEQGSTVLAEGALRRAIARVGRDNVYFLAFEENRFILDVMDLIPAGNVLTIDAASPATVTRSTLSVLRRVRALRVDAAIDLEFFARSSAILTYLSGAPRRAGLHSYAGEGPWRGDLLTHRLIYNPYLHTSDLFRLLVDAVAQPADQFPAFPEAAAATPLGAPPGTPAHTVRQPADGDMAAALKLLRDWTGLTEAPPLVLLNANCSDLLPLRRWDTARYVVLARRLLAARPDAYVAFTGRADEAAEARGLADAVSSPRCTSLAGRTTLGQLLALYWLSRVLVTNDSGPAHFATLTPIDVVTLFGPETPALFAARTPRNHVLWAGLACSPCVSAFNNRLSRCCNNICMQRISVDEVFDATLDIFQGRPDHAP